MLIAADFLLVVFSSLKTFILRSMPLTCHLSQYAPHPVILRGAEGEVAESINIEVSNII